MKRIVWEKWRDNEHYEEAVKNFNEDSKTDSTEEENELDGIKISIYPHLVKTPLGEFSVLDNNLPSKMFDCWIGHTNFPIDEEVFQVLDFEVEGIEVLRILSKYRFFVGVGKLFSLRNVSNQINEILCDKIEVVDESFIKEIMSKDPSVKRWAAIVYDNGDIEYISTSKEQGEDFEFDEMLEIMKSAGSGKFYFGSN